MKRSTEEEVYAEEREHYYHKYVLNIPKDIRRCPHCQRLSYEELDDYVDNV